LAGPHNCNGFGMKKFIQMNSAHDPKTFYIVPERAGTKQVNLLETDIDFKKMFLGLLGYGLRRDFSCATPRNLKFET
jgi:hypothetical protein